MATSPSHETGTPYEDEKTLGDRSQSRQAEMPGNEMSGHSSNPRDSSATTEVEEEWEYVTGFKLLSVICAITLSCFIIMLDISIVTTAIPSITSHFHSLGDVGWYGSAYLISSCSLQPLTGKVYARYSSKWAFISFTAIFEIGSLICGAAQSSNMLIIGRAIAGMGSAGIVNGSLTMLSACLPLHKRATYIGFMMSFAQMGILFGPLIGGALTEHANWRWCFFINLPVGAIVLAVVLLIQIPDRTSKITTTTGSIPKILYSLDVPGFLLFAPTAIMFLLALEWGGTRYLWSSATVIGLFCGAFCNLLIFLAWEWKRGDAAMIPFSIIRRRIIYMACAFVFFFFGGQIIMSYYLAIWFQAVRGVKPTLSGVYLLPSIMPQMLFAIISGVLVGKIGYYLPFAVFCGVAASIGLGLLSSLTPYSTTAQWVGYQILVGAGRGCGFQIAIVAVQNALPESVSAVALAILVFCQTFGGAVFLSTAQTTFNSGLREALHKYAPQISAQTVLTAGATHFRAAVEAQTGGDEVVVAGVVKAYNEALQHCFYLASGCAVGMFVVSFGLGWGKVAKKEDKLGNEDGNGKVEKGDKVDG